MYSLNLTIFYQQVTVLCVFLCFADSPPICVFTHTSDQHMVLLYLWRKPLAVSPCLKFILQAKLTSCWL